MLHSWTVACFVLGCGVGGLRIPSGLCSDTNGGDSARDEAHRVAGTAGCLASCACQRRDGALDGAFRHLLDRRLNIL